LAVAGAIFLLQATCSQTSNNTVLKGNEFFIADRSYRNC
jgi:hypothetical protein